MLAEISILYILNFVYTELTHAKEFIKATVFIKFELYVVQHYLGVVHVEVQA